MIEIFNKNKKRIGFIENEKFFNKKHKLIGYLDGNTVKDKSGYILLKLDNHNDIFLDNDQIGFIYNSKIFFREQPLYEISKEKREIYTSDRKKALRLIGNHEKVDELELLAIATFFLKSHWMHIIYKY